MMGAGSYDSLETPPVRDISDRRPDASAAHTPRPEQCLAWPSQLHPAAFVDALEEGTHLACWHLDVGTQGRLA